jgi:sugar lactone lactonase YvrE
VADSENNTIRKITSTGVVSTFAGTAGTCGTADLTGTSASFCSPSGVAIDSAGNLFVADTGNSTIRKIVISTGVVTTLAGIAGTCGSTDSTGTAASFCYPSGIATDSAGNLYVSDTGNYTIRKIVVSTGAVTTLAGSAGQTGFTNGTGSGARFAYPIGIATDSSGNIYVADSYDEASTGSYTIRKITAEGVVSTLAGTAGVTGSTNGTGSAARFGDPVGIATDSAGNLYVADYDNYTIRKIVISTGAVTTLAGTTGQNGFTPGALPGVLSNPVGITVSGTTLYFTSNNGVVSITNLP